MHPMDPAGQIQLAPDDAAQPWSKNLLSVCVEALGLVQKRSGLALTGPLRVLTRADERQLRQYLGADIAHVVAVAIPARREIVIVRAALFAQSPEEQLQTLVHEMTHLVIAQNIPGRLPAWLEEGLCMIFANQQGLGFTWRLTVAGSLGGVLPIEELEKTLLIGGDLQSLAYAQSLSMTQFLVRRTLAEEGRGGDSPAEFMRLLADPAEGPRMLGAMANRNWAASLDRQWRGEHRSVWNWIAILTGSSVLWVITTLLFLVAWWRKRRMSELAREKMDDDEDPVYSEDEFDER
ncbi:MAG: hypothetical protein ABFD69_17065 [Candidatus Sumerlaeia bacterium]